MPPIGLVLHKNWPELGNLGPFLEEIISIPGKHVCVNGLTEASAFQAVHQISSRAGSVMWRSCGTAPAMQPLSKEVLEKEIKDNLLDYSKEK